MTDPAGYVAYRCEWCGQDLHECDDHHSMYTMAIFNDCQGRQFCSAYCRKQMSNNDEIDAPEED